MQAASFGSKFSLGSDTKRVTEERLVLEAAALEEEVALLQAGACAQPSTRLLSTTAPRAKGTATASVWHASHVHVTC